MERRQLYIYAGIAVIVLVLLVVAVADYASWQSANAKIDHYGKLQKELSKSITYEYSADMDAAKRAWTGANLHCTDSRKNLWTA
jgi:Tfp pilus assembly protein PilN